MICQSLSTIKVRGNDGIIRELPPGEIFSPTHPEKMKPFVDAGIVRIVQDSSIIMRTVRDEVVRGGRWYPSEATRQAEKDMESVQHDKGKIIDFFEAAQRWKVAGVRRS